MARIFIRLKALWQNSRSRVAICLLCLLFFPITAQAATWEEVWPDAYFLNSDTTFVDLNSGFIFVEVAAWDSSANDYEYTYMAVDCAGWKSFAVAAYFKNRYHYFENWQNDPRSAAGPLGNTSYMAMTAQRVCSIRDSLPTDYPANRF